jgi:hypothetical protein
LTEGVVSTGNNEGIVSLVDVAAFNLEEERLAGKKELDKLHFLSGEGELVSENKLEGLITVLFVSVIGRPNICWGVLL